MSEADYPQQTASERWESLMQGMSDHHRGEHDWSSPDPYDCVVCHVLVSLYGEECAVEAALGSSGDGVAKRQELSPTEDGISRSEPGEYARERAAS